MAINFIPPEFVSGSEPESIQQRMMQNLPGDLDNMPGGFPYDFTMPTALEKSELIQFHIVRTLMLMYPMWAWGEWLDLHAQAAGLVRKEAGRATGQVIIEAEVGTVIPKGTILATTAQENPSIEFRVMEESIIGDEGRAVVDVEAVQAGTLSNVMPRTITLLSKPIKGVKKLYNEEAISGGTEKEDDDSLRERIQEMNESKGASFVGNDSDYVRWAKEVTGVGAAVVVPLWNGPGTVKLVIVDANGQPANEHILDAVYEHIVSPSNRMERLAPIGATLTVVAPDIIKIHFSAAIVLAPDYKIKYVVEEFKGNLLKYYETAKNEGILKYTKMASLLSDTQGVSDYTDFKINGGTNNIPLESDDYPETDTVAFVKGGSG